MVAKSSRAATLEVAGVGYLVFMTTDALTKIKLGQPLTLNTHLAVREDALDLFGFEMQSELSYFQLLLTVPGIGPKSALAILSLAAPEILHKAITAEDTSYLTRVSGIGRKSAEKIVVTLKDKLIPRVAGANEVSEVNLEAEAEALEALKALGYTVSEARGALKKVLVTGATSDLVKAALKTLSGPAVGGAGR